MYEKYKNEDDRRGPIVNWIQNSLRGLALIKTNYWNYDADDFVQETILRFLKGDYLQLSFQHQKNIARKIMINLFLMNNLKLCQQRLVFNRPFNYDVIPDLETRIDLATLQQYLKEREDRQVNLFWLHSIGYKVEELSRMFDLDNNTVQCSVTRGKIKLKKLIKEGIPKKKLITLQITSAKTETKVQLLRVKVTRDFNPVYQFNLVGQYVKTWINPRVAQDHFGAEGSLIRANLRGARKSAYGFYWSFNRQFKPDICQVPFFSV
jgi:DNA-directed RNA polymerase specialized sigma24 family protein